MHPQAVLLLQQGDSRNGQAGHADATHAQAPAWQLTPVAQA